MAQYTKSEKQQDYVSIKAGQAVLEGNISIPIGASGIVLFASGIVGTGLLAIPVLAGSSAYALSDGLGWKEGLSKKFRQAKGFYLIIIGSTVIGLWINLVNIDPIKALIYASIISGIIAIPLLVMLLKISNYKKVLGSKTNGLLSNILVWATIIIMGVSVFVMFVTPLV